MTTEEIVESTLPAFERFEFLSGSLMERIRFFDRSLTEWSDSLDVKLDPEMTSTDIKAKFAEIAQKIQIVSYHLSLCSNFNTALATQVEAGKSALVSKVVEDYNTRNAKRPAATVLDRLADAKYEESSTQILVSKILREFWKERRDLLIEVRKCLEMIAMTQNMELKYA